MKLVQDRNDIVLKVMFESFLQCLTVYFLGNIVIHYQTIHEILQSKDLAAIEEKIGCGQVEELIIQAQKELSLVEKMKTWKPWESLVQEAPPHQWDWPPHK